MKKWIVTVELNETYDVEAETKDDAIELALELASEVGFYGVTVERTDEDEEIS